MSSKKHNTEKLKLLRSHRVPEVIPSSVVSSYLEALDCPRSLTAALLFKYGEHEQLAKLECNPLDYSNVFEFRDAYAATKFLSKYKDLSLNYDLDKVALEKFSKFETLCGQTNRRFRALEHDPFYRGHVVQLHTAVVRKISRILGDFRTSEFFERADWGPGATTLIKARDASATNKFQCETGITRDLYDLVPYELWEEVYPLWSSHLPGIGFPTFQVGNKVITVPKDATTNRVIAVEPGLNLWFQKAVGDMIGNRLRRCGIDLRFQSRNQELARIGSIDQVNATIDFSSASDSIAFGVIEEIFAKAPQGPDSDLHRWFTVLDSCRSHFGIQGGELLRWNKFSSMGNGFTFQLESLLFFAIASCCREHLQRLQSEKIEGDVSVYGDDVIIPVACLGLFSQMCEFYGFVINVKKSSFSSTFRESCGAHFMGGIDVKPYYLKDRISDALSVYRMANGVRRLAHRRGGKLSCDANFRALFYLLVNQVPKPLRLTIPETLGDGGFIGNFDEATPPRARFGVEGYWSMNVAEVSKTYQSEGLGLLLDRVRGSSAQELRNSVTLKGRTRLRFVRSLVRQWYDLGPWL
jgi:hypothetical protein